MIDEFQNTLKILKDKKALLIDQLAKATDNNEYNEILNNIFIIDSKSKDYYKLVNKNNKKRENGIENDEKVDTINKKKIIIKNIF